MKNNYRPKYRMAEGGLPITPPDWLLADLKKDEETPIAPPEGYTPPVVNPYMQGADGTNGTIPLLKSGPTGTFNSVQDYGAFGNKALSPESNYVAPQEQKDPWMPFKTLRSAKVLFNELSGKVERNRQDQYWYNQLSTIGQMNPMPVGDFQPNPYNLYAKQGGTISRRGLTEVQYLKERGLKDAHNHGDFDNMSPNQARQILHSKKVNGEALTPEQFKLFGYLSKGNTMKYKGGGFLKSIRQDIEGVKFSNNAEFDMGKY